MKVLISFLYSTLIYTAHIMDDIMTLQRDGGGRGWLVCSMAFLVYFLGGGTVYSNGVLLPEYMDAFGAGKVATTWLISVQIGLSQCAG